MKFSIFWKLYWLRIIAFVLLALLLASIIWTITVGVQSFISMESFFKRSIQSQMALGLYQGLIQAIIFASIYMGFHYWFMFGGGISKMGSKKVKPKDVNVKWSDVVGMESVKKEVWEVIKLIKDRALVKKSGGHIIKAVLLVGPPGCGKTYLAKAIATETQLPFLHAVSSEFVGIFVGLGAQRLRTLFKEARTLGELHGGCIIFIDEIDSIARPRGTEMGGGAMTDYNATVNQLLTELDGLGSVEQNIVVMAATNVPESELDPALIRAGRFDRKIYVGLPGLKEREQIIQYYFDKIAYDKDKVDFQKLARLTVGNSPADISNITREASLIAVRKGKKSVDMADIHEAKERITLGVKSEIVLSKKDKAFAAYHEAGHAIVTYLLVPTQDVFKASIIPRRTVGGSTWIAEKEESFIPNKDDLLGKIKIALSGYVAEKIKFGTTSTNVEDDLKKVNEIAEKMVKEWGMGTSGPSGVTSGIFSHVAESDKDTIIMDCLNEINEILRKEKDILEEIAQRLLKEEELDYDQLEEIFKKYGKSRLTYVIENIRKGKKDGITWDDVVGMDEAKEEAKEIVGLIKDRAKLRQVGGQIIRGLLMFGPPGCGKTYLASAMANEAGVPFVARAGSEFTERYVGVGASRIRQLFQEAREKALGKGGCIIFIDEIDGLAGKRAPETGGGGQTEYNQTLNQLLVEMDGLKEKDARYNIVVVGATNMNEKFLDPAVLRPGRFDRKLYVELPALEDRKKLLEYYLGKVKYNPQEIDVDKFAKMTTGHSPADISNLIREAALLAVRNKKDAIGIKEIEEARERIALGLRRNIKQTQETLLKTAYHEIGHIMADHFFSKKGFPFKVSIIPRRGTLGVAWYASEGDDSFLSGDEEELRAKVKGFLGGFAAERIKFKKHETGISQDFNVAMKIAHQMVWRFGMGKSGFIGDFYSFFEESYRNQNIISEQMKAQLDFEVQQILKECAQDVEDMLKRESELFEHFAQELLKKEELNYSEIEEIFKKYAKEHPQKSTA
jgi:cell division protease FtsH